MTQIGYQKKTFEIFLGIELIDIYRLYDDEYVLLLQNEIFADI
jgi:hypothetical protein